MKRRYIDTGVTSSDSGEKRKRYCPHPPRASSHNSESSTPADDPPELDYDILDYKVPLTNDKILCPTNGTSSDSTIPALRHELANDELLWLISGLFNNTAADMAQIELLQKQARAVFVLHDVDDEWDAFLLRERTNGLEIIQAWISKQYPQEHKAIMSKYRDDTASLDEAHHNVITTLKEQHRLALAQAERRNAATMEEKDAAHRKALLQEQDNRAAQLGVQTIRVELLKADAQLASAGKDHRRILDKTEEQHRVACAKREEEYRAAQSKVAQRHRGVPAQVEERRHAEQADMEAHHHEAIIALQAKHTELAQEHAATLARTNEAHRAALADAKHKHDEALLAVGEVRVECSDLRKAIARLQTDYAASQIAESHLRSDNARLLTENAKLYAQNTAFNLQKLARGVVTVGEVTNVEDDG